MSQKDKKSWGGFEDFGRAMGRPVVKEKSKESPNEKFDRLLGGGFDQFPGGHFMTTLAGVDYVILARPKPSQKTGHVESINIVLAYRSNGEARYATLSLLGGGKISGEIPSGLKVTKEDILADVMHTVETIDLEFFEIVNDEVSPEPKKVPGGGGGGEGSDGGEPAVIDPRRLAFMKNQPKVLFGITGQSQSFNGYYSFVFPDRVIRESPKVRNAVYVFALKNPLQVLPGRFKLPPAKRMSKEERQGFIDGEWKDISGLRKKEARATGAAMQIYHPVIGMNDKEWERRMQEAIDGELNVE